MKRIRVLLVDDQALFREGLATLLGLNPQLDLVGEADEGEAAVAACARLKPAPHPSASNRSIRPSSRLVPMVQKAGSRGFRPKGFSAST